MAIVLIFSIFACNSSEISFVSSESGDAFKSFNTKSWKSVKAALCSGVKDGCKKLNIDETNFPDACNMHCVDIVKITSTAKCKVSAESVQFDSCSSNSCLWQRIKFRSFFLSTFFKIIPQASRAFSVASRNSSTDEPAIDLLSATKADLYSWPGIVDKKIS